MSNFTFPSNLLRLLNTTAQLKEGVGQLIPTDATPLQLIAYAVIALVVIIALSIVAKCLGIQRPELCQNWMFQTVLACYVLAMA